MRQRAEQERRQREKAAEKLKICNKLQDLGGVWECDQDIDDGLKKFQGKKAQTIDAIKTQIGYRRKVLEQKLVDGKLWNFSEGGVQFSPAQMTERLKLIIRQPLVKAKGKE